MIIFYGKIYGTIKSVAP